MNIMYSTSANNPWKLFFSSIKTFKDSFTKARTETIKAKTGKALVVQKQQVHAGMFLMVVALRLPLHN